MPPRSLVLLPTAFVVASSLAAAACGGEHAVAGATRPVGPPAVSEVARPAASPPVSSASAATRGIVIRHIAAAPARSELRGKTEPSSLPPSFPHDDLRTALRASYRGLRACRPDSGPTAIDGTMRFEPSGYVSAVDLVPASGVTAACVKDRLSELALLPFGGSSVDVQVRVVF